MAEQEISKIQGKCFAMKRAYQHGVCSQRELRAIDASIVNVARMADQLSTETADELKRPCFLDIKELIFTLQPRNTVKCRNCLSVSVSLCFQSSSPNCVHQIQSCAGVN